MWPEVEIGLPHIKIVTLQSLGVASPPNCRTKGIYAATEDLGVYRAWQPVGMNLKSFAIARFEGVGIDPRFDAHIDQELVDWAITVIADGNKISRRYEVFAALALKCFEAVFRNTPLIVCVHIDFLQAPAALQPVTSVTPVTMRGTIAIIGLSCG